jgi:hypothetical protein
MPMWLTTPFFPFSEGQKVAGEKNARVLGHGETLRRLLLRGARDVQLERGQDILDQGR